MELDRALEHMSVIGAGGKMGRGIAALLLLEVIKIKKDQPKGFKLILIDQNPESFNPLRNFLTDQVLKYAEKNINQLRTFYKSHLALVSNLEIIQHYIEDVLNIVQFDTSLHHTEHSKLIFEAIAEDVEIKTQTLKSIAKFADKETIFFTNTSSVPIKLLEKNADLKGRLIGFHFYNPPTIQKLVELVFTDETSENITNIAFSLAERLNKITVQSKDVAGFIGNGYFIREIHFACQVVHKLEETYTRSEAIWMVNFITQNLLLRPMGIFQLMDFVGLDVCLHICAIMRTYLPDASLTIPLLEDMLHLKLAGGQFPDASQKPGFFAYKDHQPIAIYDSKIQGYRTLEADWIDLQKHSLQVDALELLNWKNLSQDSAKSVKIQAYLTEIYNSKNLYGNLSRQFLVNLSNIANLLVETKVAASLEDVDKVLINGFYHLYGAHDLNFMTNGGHS